MDTCRLPQIARYALLRLAGLAWLSLALWVRSVYGVEYPWIYLTPENDSRESAVSENDEANSRNMVEVINQNEPLLKYRLRWKSVKIRDLLKIQTPFCEMHFDAVRPQQLTPTEKAILREYFKRGGFILFFIDAYPYAQGEFWKVREWPLIDFLAKELTASDPAFVTGRATDQFDLFNIYYRTETADSIRHELQGNPHTPNRTLLFYRNRLCAFVMGRYHFLEDGEWIPAPRPFSREFSADPKSYRLIVNIYMYAMAE